MTALTGSRPNAAALAAMPFLRCSRHACLSRGIWGLKICVPTDGLRLHQGRPLTSLFNVIVCDDHIEDVSAAEFVTQELVNRMTAYARGENKRPDFRRAFIDAIPITDREWQAFQRALAEAQGVKRS